MINNLSNKIIQYFSNLDSSGGSSDKIDTALEYMALSSYLSGSNSIPIDDICQQEGIVDCSDEQKTGNKELERLRQNLKETLVKNLTKTEKLPQITPQNGMLYANIYSDLKDENSLSDDEQKLLQKVKEALNNFLPLSDEDKTYDDLDYNWIMGEYLNFLKKTEEFKENGKVALKLIETPYDAKNLKNAIKDYLVNNKVTQIKTNADLGNGKFDKIGTQDANVCWVMGNINALLTTKEGKQLLETNRYYDKSTGLFAVHLQEAEDNGLHDGIFIITPAEIANADGKLCHGEGDTAAYIIAIQKYFDEIKQIPERLEKLETQNKLCSNVSDGNIASRFVEIITGGTSNYYNEFSDFKVQPGITRTRQQFYNYDELFDIVENKKGSVTLAIAGHCVSVIGVKKGNLLIQESNNSEEFSKEYSDTYNNHILFKPADSINGQLTYELNKDDYSHYIDEAYILKFI